ncbi:hypothetical protein N2W52_002090 [Clostridium perfringens]|nr:hypothetical protein [Clostridium perfringens]MDK0983108.1 hypothetical protein [Clostridium perfringens]
MNVKLDGSVFNGKCKSRDITLYINLVLNKPILFDSMKVNLKILMQYCGLEYKNTSHNPVRESLSRLKDNGLIDFNVDLNKIKNSETFVITIKYDLKTNKKYMRITEKDIEIIKELTPKETILYFFIQKNHDKKTGKVNITLKSINIETGLGLGTVQKALNKFSEIGILRVLGANIKYEGVKNVYKII